MDPTWKAIVRELKTGPAPTAEISKATRISLTRVKVWIKRGRAGGWGIRIAGWERSHGRISMYRPVYGLGQREDEPRPKSIGRNASNRKYAANHKDAVNSYKRDVWYPRNKDRINERRRARRLAKKLAANAGLGGGVVCNT